MHSIGYSYFIFAGTSIMVLLDKTSLQNNINAMDKSMISSGDIIKRFQNYISYVSLV